MVSSSWRTHAVVALPATGHWPSGSFLPSPLCPTLPVSSVIPRLWSLTSAQCGAGRGPRWRLLPRLSHRWCARRADQGALWQWGRCAQVSAPWPGKPARLPTVSVPYPRRLRSVGRMTRVQCCRRADEVSERGFGGSELCWLLASKIIEGSNAVRTNHAIQGGAGFEVPWARWFGKRVAVEVSLIQIEYMTSFTTWNKTSVWGFGGFASILKPSFFYWHQLPRKSVAREPAVSSQGSFPFFCLLHFAFLLFLCLFCFSVLL